MRKKGQPLGYLGFLGLFSIPGIMGILRGDPRHHSLLLLFALFRLRH
ncbi:MAG: hypothetical protein ACLFU8_17785 [Anaerolineales bacterium]